ncbi:MAG TPA: copper chaperone PCu(A)C [Xanthobacteraceae bacterium]|jgi:copper(I)-binding protein
MDDNRMFCLAKMSLSALALAALVCVAAPAAAHDYKVGTIEIGHPWARATPKGATIAGGYLKLTNSGTEADRLIDGSLPSAGRFEIHQMSMNNGVMQMRPVSGGLEIKPGQTIEFTPGGFHLMFLDLKAPLVQKQPVKGTLVFEKAGTIEIEYAVEPIGSTPAQSRPGTHMGH